MNERKRDQLLGIRTTGLREWVGHSEYNRYEATPYLALDTLFQVYKVFKNAQVVDFGCGRGRVAFYIHNSLQIPVTGVEASDITFNEALDNEYAYQRIANHIKAPLAFEYGLAQHYQIKPNENCFYFFNPFAVTIFKKVITNILHSYRSYERTIELILYYPTPKYKQFLRAETSFEIVNKIRVPQINDHRSKFIIYRLEKPYLYLAGDRRY